MFMSVWRGAICMSGTVRVKIFAMYYSRVVYIVRFILTAVSFRYMSVTILYVRLCLAVHRVYFSCWLFTIKKSNAVDITLQLPILY